MDKVKQPARSYGQFCGLARALDLVGDRWTLLIVRELLAGPMRYSALKASLAGAATNLLAERLRTLEANGITERRLDGTGVVYALTAWGAALREPMEALGRWAAPLLATGRGEDAFQPRWLVLALPALLRGATFPEPVELGVETDGFLLVLRVDADGVRARGAAEEERPGTVFSAEPDTVIALAAGAMTAEEALRTGGLHGDAGVLRAVFGAARER